MLKRSTLAVCFLVLIISLGTIMNDQGGLTTVTPNHSEFALPASDHSQEHPFHAIDRVRLDEADQRLIELVRERRRMRENYSVPMTHHQTLTFVSNGESTLRRPKLKCMHSKTP